MKNETIFKFGLIGVLIGFADILRNYTQYFIVNRALSNGWVGDQQNILFANNMIFLLQLPAILLIFVATGFLVVYVLNEQEQQDIIYQSRSKVIGALMIVLGWSLWLLVVVIFRDSLLRLGNIRIDQQASMVELLRFVALYPESSVLSFSLGESFSISFLPVILVTEFLAIVQRSLPYLFFSYFALLLSRGNNPDNSLDLSLYVKSLAIGLLMGISHLVATILSSLVSFLNPPQASPWVGSEAMLEYSFLLDFDTIFHIIISLGLMVLVAFLAMRIYNSDQKDQLLQSLSSRLQAMLAALIGFSLISMSTIFLALILDQAIDANTGNQFFGMAFQKLRLFSYANGVLEIGQVWPGSSIVFVILADLLSSLLTSLPYWFFILLILSQSTFNEAEEVDLYMEPESKPTDELVSSV